mmetsp:Transcript_100199/g.150230  ORF Transcript_100199/g.150230 Transcript_100199/m.150230 type:complete len:236 (-) Transcript_100199:27-734(-)
MFVFKFILALVLFSPALCYDQQEEQRRAAALAAARLQQTTAGASAQTPVALQVQLHTQGQGHTVRFGSTGLFFEGIFEEPLVETPEIPVVKELQFVPRILDLKKGGIVTGDHDDGKAESFAMALQRATDWLHQHRDAFLSATVMPQVTSRRLAKSFFLENKLIPAYTSWDDEAVSTKYVSVLVMTTDSALRQHADAFKNFPNDTLTRASASRGMVSSPFATVVGVLMTLVFLSSV